MTKKIDFKRVLGFVLCCVACFSQVKAQDAEVRYHVSGKIIDARTKKGIKKIPVTVLPFNRMVHADGKGAFLFNMPAGKYSFLIDYYPFDKQEVTLSLQSDTTLSIELHCPVGSFYLEEVEVISSKPATEQPAGMEQIDSHMLKALPAMIGERDILKAFALTSGVTSSSEGAADMQVRGGVHGQNLYLLDDIPLFSTEHFFGLVSVYNPTSIKSARLYKSGFPAEYGGKISSVLNVLTEDATLDKFKGVAETGILSSKVGLNIPIVKDKLALTIAGRLSNYSLVNIVSPFIPEKIGTRFSFHFGDINANMIWKVSKKDKLKLTFFSNTDGIDVNSLMDDARNKMWIKNNQQNAGINWYRTVSDKSENHLLVYGDRYGYDYGNSSQSLKTSAKQIVQILTGINSAGVVEKFRFKLSDQLMIKAGGSVKTYGFAPYQVNQSDTSIHAVKVAEVVRQTEGVVFGESDYQFARQHTLTAGLRVSTVGNVDKMYTNLEPRLGYHGIFRNDYSISASVDRMTQPIHRVANSGLGFPFEMFVPSGALVQPESSWNFSLGGAKDFTLNKNRFSLKAEAWYKSMQHVVEFQDGYDAVYTTIISPQPVAQDTRNYITQGNGTAYGIDFSADYNTKGLSVTADYTLMKAEYRFDLLNNGLPFAAPTDIRNSLSLTTEVELSDTWSFSATWQYQTGRQITVPDYIFINPATGGIAGELRDFDGTLYQRVETQRNNYRTRPFHKLDISFTHNYKAFKRYNASISLGIYNVYNRANPYIYFIDGVETTKGHYEPVLKSMSMFPILPSFTWVVKF